MTIGNGDGHNDNENCGDAKNKLHNAINPNNFASNTTPTNYI